MIRLDFNKMTLSELMTISRILKICYEIENGRIVSVNKNILAKSGMTEQG